ncbi:MAG: glycosyltransferase family 4 protein [Lachnospiraceae bacterium]|nr:glycosyltransferase family 4 protein [Lachnospiraceae bacterium]
MRLVIDCFKLVKGAGKSIGIYNLALNLVRELASSSDDNELIVIGNKYNRKDFALPKVKFVEIRKDPHNKIICIFWELFEVSILARKLKADKLLFPRGYVSMLHLTRESAIIHDMIPFYYHENYPGYFNRLENFYIMWRLKVSARKADDVITISEASKQDIIKYAHVPADRIVVINNGYNLIAKKKYTTPNEAYILAVASELPHKNAAGIVKSYEKYCHMTDNPLKLKIVGIADAGKFTVDTMAAKNINCFKYIEKNEDFYQLIYGAEVFLFLSMIEGFGFPPIEAMQLGTAVVCSDKSSLPEVAGDAAIYVNPDDYSNIAQALIEILEDEDRRRQLQMKGFENVKRFSWDKTGKKYREILFKNCIDQAGVR